MAKELEAKFQLSCDEASRLMLFMSRLKGSKFKYSRFETNEFFDTKKQKLEGQDEILRLRTCVPSSNTEKEYYIVTHKGPKLKSKIKCREETEVQVHSAEDTRALFRVLGYEPTFSFDKRRTSYSYANCLVEIDWIARLGYFCEIEGKTQKQIRVVMKRIGFPNAKLITSGYGTLLKEAKVI